MPEQDTQPSQPQRSELASFGEELRREREIRGISLKEIADATKISKRFLEAIERNDHNTLPAPVFTRGFVREYARYLGLNSEEMVNRYNYAAAGDERIEKPPAHPVPPPLAELPKKARPKRGIPPVYARIDRNLILLVFIAAALGAVVFWAVKYKQRSAADDPAATDTAVPIGTARAPIATPKPAAQTPVNDDTLRLVVEAVDSSWVTLEADGKTVLNTELSRGERRTFEAKEEFRFRTIGNAAGINLQFNETAVPSLGDDGEVVKNRVFDREALRTLRETPRSVS